MNKKTTIRHLHIPVLLALLCWVAVPAAARQDVCHDTIFIDAHSKTGFRGYERGNYVYDAHGEKIDNDAYEYRDCTPHQQISKDSGSYVIVKNQLYFNEGKTSIVGACVGNIGIFSSIGRGFCPFGKTTYLIGDNKMFPLEFKPDPKVFRVLSENYGTASGKVYYKQFVIAGAQSLPAEILLRLLPSFDAGSGIRQGDSDYAVYGDQIFFQGQLVEGADAASFQALYFKIASEGDSYSVYDKAARDKARVYWEGQMLDDSHPDAFDAADSSSFRAGQRLWSVLPGGKLGMIVDKLPENLGGGFFRSRHISPQGKPYARVWRIDKKLDDGRAILQALPLRMSEGDEFAVLPAGCPPEAATMPGYPDISCAPFKYQAATVFGRTQNKIFVFDTEVPGVDVASFQLLSAVVGKYEGYVYAKAIDAHRFHLFGTDSHSSVPLQGKVTLPIPDRYGNFFLFADAANIYDASGWGKPNMEPENLCRYDGPSSTRGLKVVSRNEGRDRQSYIELENDRYRYVFYSAKPEEQNNSHIIDLRTNQRLRMYGSEEQPCKIGVGS